MVDTKTILSNRFIKLERHIAALKDYYHLIKNKEDIKNIYNPDVYNNLSTEEKAVLDAYLKRFFQFRNILEQKYSRLLQI
ncbi:MAG: hypothetical protein PQJ61_05265 [Spirochaetales bacterium]|uniref:Uncharacterized protein n=1 Tax=Candidatus Thalassospirochaeta sargassi TaxID=3119039 RepID=A0AAJ1IE22_9SPIO|nr:hypothetical protein [Spirochaetales bacterium]